MQIHKCTLQNFGSYGHNPVTIEFDENDKLMGLLGKNGNGKSFLMDAIMYGLYGVSFRKIKKTDLVNRINQKDMFVRIEFSSKGSRWAIERTLRDVEIFKGTSTAPMQLEAHMYDIQKHITSNIIGISENIFRTVVMVAMRNFKSFFSLPRDKRRELFESIIDIGTLRDMRKMFNVKLNNLSSQQRILDQSLKNLQTNLETGQQNYNKLISIDDNSIQKMNDDYNNLNDDLNDNNKQKKEIDFEEDILQKKKILCSKSITSLEYEKKDLMKQMKVVEEEKLFFTENDVCLRCRGKLTKKQKSTELKILIQKEKDINNRVVEIDKEEIFMNHMSVLIKDQLELHDQLNNAVQSVKIEMSSLSKQIEEVNATTANSELKTDLVAYIDTQKESLAKVESDFGSISEFINIIEIFKNVLSDEGLKRFIYNQFLPKLNKYINDILKEFEFNIRFELLENLQEVIYNKMGEEIGINTFSAGEQQLIDMSFMFGLQKFLEKVNNFNSKICFIDELLDSSLDAENLEKIKNFMRSDERNKQIIIITHKMSIKEMFDSCYTVKKINEFSTITKD